MSGNYDSEKHHRRSIRLKSHDYSGGGLYFVTICAHREFITSANGNPFGVGATPVLPSSGRATQVSPVRKIIAERMRITAEKHPAMRWDEAVIMPDHFHALIRLDCGVALGDIIGGFKAAVSRTLRRELNLDPGMRIWHRNYYEMIVSTPEAAENICTYIRMNPRKIPFALPLEGGSVRATGNPVLLNFPKTGILCSRKIPAGVDYMPPIDEHVVYMSGFHSPPEKEIFKVLLARAARIIYCPAWPINEMALTPFAEALKENRLLIIEILGADASLVSARRRNEFVMQQADRLWIPYCTPGGMLDQLIASSGMQNKRIQLSY